MSSTASSTMPLGSTASAAAAEMTTDVNSIVEKLQELCSIIKSRMPFESRQAAEDDIEEVIQHLRELDQQRLLAHEKLEAETITCSVLRHRVSTFDNNLRAEVTRAVAAARDSNSTQLKELQDKLMDMDKESDQLGKKHEVLELHNEVLQPELSKLQTDHERLVETLNAEVSQRTSMKIVLNETEEKLRETNTQTRSLESTIAALEEKLRLHKEQYTNSKKESLMELDLIRVKLDDQTIENSKLSSTIGQIESELVDSALALKDKQRIVRYIEASIERLLACEADLREKLLDMERSIALLNQTEIRTAQQSKKDEEMYKKRQKDVEGKIEQTKREIEIAGKETSRLNEIRKKLKREMKLAKDARDLQSTGLADIRASVDQAKRRMLFESGEGARLMAENRELEFRLNQTRDTHKSNVQLFKEEIAELRDQLSRESKLRQQFEDTNNDVEKQIQAQLTEHALTMRTLTAKIVNTEDSDQELAMRTVSLKKEIEDLKSTKGALEQDLQSKKAELQHTKRALEDHIVSLEDSIAELTEELCDHVETLKEKEPVLQSLEVEYDTTREDYEVKKKEVIGLKNKRTGLEDMCKKLETDLSRMYIPQDKLRMEALRRRAYTRRWLHQQEAEVEKMEEKVAERQQQLSAVLNENKRFEETRMMLETESDRLRSLYESGSHVGKAMDMHFRECRDGLAEQWKENKKMEEAYCERDKAVLKDISMIKDHSDERLQTLSDLHAMYDEEITKFTHFLHTAASKRRKSSFK